MKQATIPDDVLSDFREVNLIDYRSNIDQHRIKVAFSQCVFSFLVDGHKEIYHSHRPAVLGSRAFALITSASCLMTEKRVDATRQYRSVLLSISRSVLESFKKQHYAATAPSSTLEAPPVLTFHYDEYLIH